MLQRIHGVACLAALVCASANAEVLVAGRVVDETGAAVAGARVELRGPPDTAAAVASSDQAGNFKMELAQPGEYQIRADRQGFYRYEGARQNFASGPVQLFITLNHVQQYSERIDVKASAAVIDPQEPVQRKELDNAEVEAVPYPAPEDYRAGLPLMDGVVQDNAGRPHFNGGAANQTNYTLDGFNMSNPVTGGLDTRINVESIQSMDLESSRFSAENGRGSSGVLDVKTKMGDDVWRFDGTNFFPGVSSESGLHVNKWTPRAEFSGPLAKGRAWFDNGLDAFYDVDIVHGLPGGQNQTTGLTTSDLSRFQVNLKPGNILTAGFLMNFSDRDRYGLSFVNPAEATTNQRQTLYMTTVRDQIYFGRGAVLELGFADSRGQLRDTPQGNQLYQITPLGNRGNYFVNLDRHQYRDQGIANLFLAPVRWGGEHQFKLGIDFEREAFHQKTALHDYEVLREDNSLARYVQFVGSPFQARRNFETAQFAQDRWTPRKGVMFEAGLRAEWNEIVRTLEVAPRFSAVWAPGFLRQTKFSAGWGVYYDAISLGLLTRQQGAVSYSTYYPMGGIPGLPVQTLFAVNEQALQVPAFRSGSVSVERALPFGVYGRASYLRRSGSNGFAYEPLNPEALLTAGMVTYALFNTRREVYDAFEVSIRKTFASKYEWFAGYTRSSARSNAAIDYSVENPIFGLQTPGAAPWDTPNRFHMWGWAPLPNRPLPETLRFLTHETDLSFLFEYRTGFPFGLVNENAFLIGRPDALRYPNYFNLNLALERRFHVLHILWAWRIGLNNVTNNSNPNAVNNIVGSPLFLAYGRGQARSFAVRLRMLGRK